MQEIDLISVVIPVYNAGPYLKRCIESVLSQDYPSLEIVLVDDGSTDLSGKLCDEYAVRFPEKVRVVHQSNAGASLARKRGIGAARGAFLTFVDSDDYVAADYVSRLYGACRRFGTDVAVCPMLRLNPDESPAISQRSDSRLLPREELFKRFFRYEFWGFPCGLYRSAVFANMHFPEATVNEDYYVKARIFVSVEPVACVDEPLYFYEQHPGSLSKQQLSLRALGEFDNAKATWEFIRDTCPEFAPHALAIAAEAACKWLSVLNGSRPLAAEFQDYRFRIVAFIRKNFTGILFTPHLLWKVKIVMLKNLLS